MLDKPRTDYVLSVDMALQVLMHVARSPDCRLTDIAASLRSTKPRILRLLRTMERRGMVQRAPSGGYRLGNALLVLGTAAASQIDLVKLAGPVIEALALKVSETVQLRIVDGRDALCIAKFEPARDLRVHALIGRRRPLHAGSSKVLMAWLPTELQRELLPPVLNAFTDSTITEPGRLLHELDAIRARGYCVSRGEVSEQLVSVAVPVRAWDGSVVAALNIAAPAFRTQQSDIDRYLALLLDSANRISSGLGWTA